MADKNSYSRVNESGRKEQDAARGTVHGQPRTGYPRGPHGADLQPYKPGAPEVLGDGQQATPGASKDRKSPPSVAGRR
jgi:hypothetical protein